MLNTTLQCIMENFYLCSHLNIYAFNNRYELVLATGDGYMAMDYTHLMKDWLIEAVSSLDKQNHYMVTPTPFVHFSICPINQQQLTDGFYIIGPYTTGLHLKEQFLLKPAHCIPPLLSLLQYFSVQDTPTLSTEEEVCNYHIERAKQYICKHYCEPITLEDLSSYLKLNKSYLCTIFKKATKSTFCTYTNQVRIEKSKELLINSQESILEIALSVGFSSASYFNTTFKKYEQITPLEYRNKVISEKQL